MLLLRTLSILSVVCALSPQTQAQEKLYFDGFIGAGFFHESANNFVSSTGDSHEIVEFGLRASYEYSDNLTFTGQVGFRRFGEVANDNGARIEYAQMNYTTRLFEDSEQLFSVGRIKNQLGLYNLARDITLSRPSILLPQSAYLEFWRNLFLSTNGVSVGSDFYLDSGVLSATISAGQVKIDNNFNEIMLGNQATGTWSKKENIIADLRYAHEHFKIGVSFHTVKPRYSAGQNARIPFIPLGSYVPAIDGMLQMNSYLMFAQTTIENLEVSAEYTLREADIEGFTAAQSVDRSMEGYYVQAKYATSPTTTVTLRYEDFYRLSKHKSGLITPFFTFPSYYNNARTISLSGSYQIANNWTLMADLHFVEGAGFLAPFATPTPASVEKKNWTLSAMQIIYSF